MLLKIRQLEVFKALLEEGSVSKAALRLNLSQPAVSVALSNLESDLGFSLFERRNGAFAPTPEADLLQQDAEMALLAAGRAESRARQIREGSIGAVRIASYGAAAIQLLPDVVASFHQTRADVDIDIQVRTSQQVLSFVAEGQADLGFVETPSPRSDLSYEFFTLDCVCIMRADDPLSTLDAITPADLDGREVIGIAKDHVIDRQMAAHFAKAGVALKSPIKSYFFATARNLVRAGAGIAVVDAINGRATYGDGVTSRPFLPRTTYEMALVHASRRQLTLPVQTFVDVLRRHMAGFTR